MIAALAFAASLMAGGDTTLPIITYEREFEYFKGDTSITWVVHLEPGGKKLDVHVEDRIYRFITRKGKIVLDTIVGKPLPKDPGRE